MIDRNTYIGDPEYDWDLRVARNIHLNERLTMVAAFDAFNLLNRANIDEVTSVYGSPVFCGAIPLHYNDATTRAIQQQAASVTCPNGGITVPGGSDGADSNRNGSVHPSGAKFELRSAAHGNESAAVAVLGEIHVLRQKM